MPSPYPPVPLDGRTYHWYHGAGADWYLAEYVGGQDIAWVRHSNSGWTNLPPGHTPSWEVSAFPPLQEGFCGRKLYLSGKYQMADSTDFTYGLEEAMEFAVAFYFRCCKNVDNFRKLPTFQKWVAKMDG